MVGWPGSPALQAKRQSFDIRTAITAFCSSVGGPHGPRTAPFTLHRAHLRARDATETVAAASFPMTDNAV